MSDGTGLGFKLQTVNVNVIIILIVTLVMRFLEIVEYVIHVLCTLGSRESVSGP